MANLDLDLFAPADREISITVDGQRRMFPIRGSLPLTKMIHLIRLETRLNHAYAGEPVDAGGEVEDVASVLEEMYGEVVGLIRERTPDAPDLDLDQHQVLALLGFIAGGESVAATVADTLTMSPDVTADASVSQVDEQGGAPLDSTRHSESPSSGSAGSTGGVPSGGETAPGPASASTSETLTTV